jgi:hypothetical protein
MDDITILLEHIDLFNCLNGLDIHLLQCGLQLLVIGTARLVDLLRLASRRAFASAEKGCSLVWEAQMKRSIDCVGA